MSDGYIYLITELDREKEYKIGVTKNKNLCKRLSQLQTGNSSELFIIKSYKSKHPFKLEKWLHRHYSDKHKLNEWYELEMSDVEEFTSICNKYESMFESLSDNPYFK